MSFKRVSIKSGADSKAFCYCTVSALDDQLRASLRLGSITPFELVDETGAIVPLQDLEDNGSYTLKKIGGDDWTSRPLWQTKDPIHGLIGLPDVCLRFIDTPEFQRLRDLKQIGSCYLVYMGGHHTRFDHSIGVACLAFKMVSSICNRQPELKISAMDILCVTLAALCHDLGHGAGSHMWDSAILKRLGVDMPHEEMSLLILDNIIKTVRSNWAQMHRNEDPFDGLNEADIVFIKALIHPPTEPYTVANVGRSFEKLFLMDIVSNKTSGLDVDKFDYIQRDTHNTGVRGVFDVDRLINNVSVRECEGQLLMCWPQKELEGITEIFHTRDSLHRRVYQHRTNISIESMFRDAVLAAAPCVQIRNDRGEWLDFTESQRDVSTFVKVSDWFFHFLLHGKDFKVDWDDPRIGKARSLLSDIQNRRIWKFVGTVFGKLDSYEKVKLELERCSSGYIPAEQWELKTAMFSWGQGDRNPLENVPFTKKNNSDPMKPRPEDLSRVFVPAAFREHILYVFVKSQDHEVRELAKASFQQWSTELGIESSLVDMSSVTLSKKPKRKSTISTPSSKRASPAGKRASPTGKRLQPARSPPSANAN